MMAGKLNGAKQAAEPSKDTDWSQFFGS
jgi:hypothetical protein